MNNNRFLRRYGFELIVSTAVILSLALVFAAAWFNPFRARTQPDVTRYVRTPSGSLITITNIGIIDGKKLYEIVDQKTGQRFLSADRLELIEVGHYTEGATNEKNQSVHK